MSRKSGSRSSSRRSKKSGGGSNVFDMFTQRQVAEFKEGFQLMDRDKDGVIGKNDLRGTFDEIGRICNDQELDEMLADAPGPINFTMLLNMFAERSTGEADDDDVVAKAFLAFSDEEGNIDCDVFRHALMTWGDIFSAQEADDALDQMDVDEEGKIDAHSIIQMLTAGASDDAAAEEEAAA
ncbi:myosin regulatory light chain 2-like [Portunus trituberculatus]|uniref:Myosin regulatory light chain 2 n=1 Tax=Portunus trituberculatus TaxID=210409 RepID=A0A5B7K1R7_PORTR|nr:myosin regulatory light chain 2-like [Portunus trituberculatus]MPD00477.1 Myosin regulatory light chain 2 [Portunus trituberculatus]